MYISRISLIITILIAAILAINPFEGSDDYVKEIATYEKVEDISPEMVRNDLITPEVTIVITPEPSVDWGLIYSIEPPVVIISESSLRDLIEEYFLPEDYEWAYRITFCESSAQPDDTYSDSRHLSSGASGWFQHLPKFWDERSVKAGFEGYDIFNPEANVGVASWLFYKGGGPRHWVCK